MSKKRAIIILSICLVILAGLYWYVQIDRIQRQSFQVTFFDVGQGDAALIRFADGKKMLVDCGIDQRILYKLGRALPFYDRTIDYLVVTHPDADHYGGCPKVLERYQVRKIFFNGDSKSGDPYWRAWEKHLNESTAEKEILRAPLKLAVAEAELNFMAPDDSLAVSPTDDAGNNRSIVFQLIYLDKSFLFTGDMEKPLEEAILARYCPPAEGNDCLALRADYLKVGHHGSDSSSSQIFLEKVQPRTAILSVGRYNNYGHPSFRVLARLKRIQAKILRTDELGDIIIK